MINYIEIDSAVGRLELAEQNDYLIGLTVIEKANKNRESSHSKVLNQAVQQLNEYFSGKRKYFDLALKQDGTDFQQAAWKQLLKISYAKTISYKELAEAVNSPKAYRAVGSANGKNNIAIIVPCHRVINADGELGGYAYGLKMKSYLLDLEKRLAK